MSLIALCAAALLLAAAGAALADAPRVAPLDPPAMGVRVIGGEMRVGRETVRVKGVGRLRVEPAAVVEVRDERVTIADGKINRWIGGTSLPGVVTGRSEVRLWGCLEPGSLTVRSEKDGAGITYQAGKDYLCDETWGAIARKPGGRIAEGATVFASYTCGMERLDTVQVDASGRVSIRRGRDAKVCALPALPERGARAMAHIYMAYHTEAVAAELIYPVGPRVGPVVSEDPQRFVAGTLARLRAGKPVTVVFLGDSVTAGGNATSPEKRCPDLFAARLQRLFPEAKVAMVNAGIGGTNSDLGLERLDKDVLAHKPDLVVIEFVNDMFWPPAKIEANYAQLTGRIREAGAEVIICTPHLMAPFWMDRFEAAAQALREAARANEVGLADVARMWGNLEGQGVPYMTLLANRINHPDNRGHRLFAEALLAFFR